MYLIINYELNTGGGNIANALLVYLASQCEIVYDLGYLIRNEVIAVRITSTSDATRSTLISAARAYIIRERIINRDEQMHRVTTHADWDDDGKFKQLERSH